jgi:hypothetical protein
MEFRPLSPEIEWAQADPDSELFFPPVHGGGTLVFSVNRWPGELFTLWMPENVHAAGVHPLKVREGTWERDENRLVIRGQSLSNDGTAVCAYVGEVQPAPRGLRLALRIRNLTSRPWSDPWVNICLKLAHAPSFDDPRLARTFVRFAGRWTPLAEKALLDHRNHYRIVLTELPCASMIEHLSAENIMTTERADHNLVAVSDPGGGRSVGVFSREAVVLVFNGSERVRCVHSNPRAVPYGVPPGGEATAESYLLFVDAPPASLADLVDLRFGTSRDRLEPDNHLT